MFAWKVITFVLLATWYVSVESVESTHRPPPTPPTLPKPPKIYGEKYRPQLRFSPPSGWMNDPNGLVYHDGLFHMFYQHTPNKVTNGPLYWGHAVSSDLVHWRNLPIALRPERGYSIFSGCAIVDTTNATGLVRPNSFVHPLLAIFTASNIATGDQEQWLAYSYDGPLYTNFKYYERNPIVPNTIPGLRDFRDPQVFRYKEHFVMVLAAFNRSLIYNSPNLLNWTLVSEFGEREGSHLDVWECPSLFPINVTANGSQVEKWVLIIDSGPYQQYFVGSFDGKTFKNDNPPSTELWVDYGPDSYAGITYNLGPDNRRFFISWMNRWEYALNFNFSIWNGQMGVAREVKLMSVPGKGPRLATLPVREFEALRVRQIHNFRNVVIGSNSMLQIGSLAEGPKKHLLDIELTVDLSLSHVNDTLTIELSDFNDKLNVIFNGREIIVDRGNAGRTDFGSKYGLVWKAPRISNSTDLKLRIILDQSSIEVFADDGLSVLAALYFSEEDLARNIKISHESAVEPSSIILKSLIVHELKSIW